MTASSSPGGGAGVRAFAAPYAPADETLAPALLAAASRSEAAEARIDGDRKSVV